MKLNLKRSILAISMLMLLILSIAMVSASSDISTDDTADADDSVSDDVSSVKTVNSLASSSVSDDSSDTNSSSGSGDDSSDTNSTSDSANDSSSTDSTNDEDSTTTAVNKTAYFNISASDIIKDSASYEIIFINLKDAEDDSIVNRTFTVQVLVYDEETEEFTGTLLSADASNGRYVNRIACSDLSVGNRYYVIANFTGDDLSSDSSDSSTGDSNSTIINYEAVCSDSVYFRLIDKNTTISITGDSFNDCEDSIVSISLYNLLNETISKTLNFTLDDNTYSVDTGSSAVELNLGTLSAGEHTLYAEFVGDSKYYASTAEYSFNVAKSSYLSIEASDVYSGESENVVLNLLDIEGLGLNGTVNVYVYNSKGKLIYTYSIDLVDGEGSFDLNVTEDYVIIASFAGTDDILSSSAYGSIRLLENAVKIPVVANATIDLTYDGDSSVIVALKDLDGNPISNGELSVVVNGEESSLSTDENGTLTVAISTNSTVEVTYVDADNCNASVSSKIIVITKIKERAETAIQCTNVSVKAVPTVDGKIGSYYYFNLTDGNGNPLANKTVKLGFNGQIYTLTTNDTGGAKLQINVALSGTYTMSISFLGDDDYKGSFAIAKITVKIHTPKITASAKTFKKAAKTKKLTATFKTSNGNAISGKKLVFIINGKLYSAKTNSKGVATVKISLTTKGTYYCTVSWVGDNYFKATSKKFKVKIK